MTTIEVKNDYMLGRQNENILYYKCMELEQENKQLKEQLENDIDRYEDTISYQLGFDKGKEYLQQKIDKAIEYIKNASYFDGSSMCANDLLEILGGNNETI